MISEVLKSNSTLTELDLGCDEKKKRETNVGETMIMKTTYK